MGAGSRWSMWVLHWGRLGLGLWMTALLFGCATDETVRGRLVFDVRPAGAQPEVLWPQAPDEPRLAYVGELYGQPNFLDEHAEKRSTLVKLGRWLTGLDEQSNPTMVTRPTAGYTDAQGRIYVADIGVAGLLVFDPKAAKEVDEAQRGQLLLWRDVGPQRRLVAPVAVTGVWDDLLAVSDGELNEVMLLSKQKGQWVGRVGEGVLSRPTGLAYDPAKERLFVADTEAHEVHVFSKDGTHLGRWGQGRGTALGEFNAPTHLAWGPDGLYVTDNFNHRVQVFSPEGVATRVVGERGVRIGQLSRPKGVAVTGSGITLVIESLFNHLLLFNREGQFLMGVDGSGLHSGQMNLPSGVWMDAQGLIYIADMFGERVLVLRFIDPSERNF